MSQPSASPHSVDGVNWFLTDTRSMLYLEKGDTLQLLPGVPRKYLENGKQIVLENVRSYFGLLSLHLESHLDRDEIVATIECSSDRRPKRVELRVPHPDGRVATWVHGGRYDSVREIVVVEPFTGKIDVAVGFAEPQ